MGKIATGPGPIPVIIPGTPETDMLAMVFSDQPITTIATVYDTDTFSDALPHDLASTQVLAGRTSPTKFFVTAHDDANNRVAFASADISLSRAASGTISLLAINGFGAFNPNLAPWSNITANAVVVGTDFCAVRVVGLAGVTIRWSAWIGISGAQGR